MKGFFLEERASADESRGLTSPPATAGLPAARIAVYDTLTAAPRTEDVLAEDAGDFIQHLSERTYDLSRQRGGRIPYTVIREIAENLWHASFRDVVVSILPDGSTIRFSDRGPGIRDKEKAFQPGFTTAEGPMRRYIRGVGSGLPIVRESLSFSGGVVDVEDNLDSGTVVTLAVPDEHAARHVHDPLVSVSSPHGGTTETSSCAPQRLPELGERHKRVLSLVLEIGSLGPTKVSRELGVGLSTAYRDLSFLEEIGMLSSDQSGKRILTDRGVEFLDSIISGERAVCG